MTEDPLEPWEEQEVSAAAAGAGAIGGRAGDEDLDPSQRPVAEGGEGEDEGYELAEQDQIEGASHGDSDADPLDEGLSTELDQGDLLSERAEADLGGAAEPE